MSGRSVNRRTLLTAGSAAALLVAGGAAEWRSLLPGLGSPDDAAADYVKLLSDVRGDYISGRVVEHEGWVLSQHEFDTIEQRQAEAAANPPAPTLPAIS